MVVCLPALHPRLIPQATFVIDVPVWALESVTWPQERWGNQSQRGEVTSPKSPEPGPPCRSCLSRAFFQGTRCCPDWVWDSVGHDLCRTHPSLSPHQGITFHVRSAFPRHPAGGEASPPSLQTDLQASGLCFRVFNKEDPSLHFQCPSASTPCELQDSPAKVLMITLFL